MNDGCGCCVDPAYQYDGKCECACHDDGVTVTCACPQVTVTVYEAERPPELEDDQDELGDEWYRLY